MSESTPLISKNIAAAEQEEYIEEEYEEFEFNLSPNQKYALYGVSGLLCIGLLYFFTIFLPDQFIPKPIDLVDFNKVESLNIKLIPFATTQKYDDDGLVEDDGDEEFDWNMDVDEEQLEWSMGVDDDQLDNGSSETTSKKSKYQRIIMLGDIHGHYIHLRNMLRKIKYNPKKDYLLVLGDFVAKGPDSVKVVEYLTDHKIDCVLGNHEYYVLQNYAQFHGLDFPNFVANGTKDVLFSRGMSSAGFNDDPEFLLAKKLEGKHIEYLNSCSLIKKLGAVPVYSKKAGKKIIDGIASTVTAPGVAVHGGLRWDLSLEDQIPEQVLEMRSLIGPNYNETTDDPHEINAVSWSKIWNFHQKKLSPKHKTVVYYGHDARRGLNVKPFARGIDTGCDRGEKLLALILWDELDASKQLMHMEKVVQVKC